VRRRASPGRLLRMLNVCHAAIGIVVYRRELGAIAADGIVGSVPSRGERAAAMWFIGSALPGWLVGHLVDVAADAGDEKAVRLAGALGVAGGTARAILAPNAAALLQIAVCVRLLSAPARIPIPDSAQVMQGPSPSSAASPTWRAPRQDRGPHEPGCSRLVRQLMLSWADLRWPLAPAQPSRTRASARR
jgi:hypothetical protein